MRYRATIPDIRQALAGAEVQVAKSVTAGIREVEGGLKQDLRDDVTEGGPRPAPREHLARSDLPEDG